MSAGWKQRPEVGGRVSLRLGCFIASRGGRSVARVLLYPVTLYFMLKRSPERRASRAYLSRVLGRPSRWWDTARHLHCFASVILDRVFLLGGRMDEFQVDVTGLSELHAQLDKGQGVLVFGAHLGSFDALRVLAQARPDVQVKVVLDKAHAPAIAELLGALNRQLDACIIDASMDSTSIVMAIKQAADEGALVALLVDRVLPKEPTLPAQFLGAQAHFPTSPWLVAAALKVPVVLAFGVYHGKARYSLAFEAFSERLDVPRGNRASILGEHVRRYAERLEHHTRAAPYNWFNFYDFWTTEHADAPQAAVDADAAVQRRTALRRTA